MKSSLILERVKDHLVDVRSNFYSDKDWFVICLQGSQNYGLADEESDVDTKMLLLPSMRDLVLNNKAVSKTCIRDNNEHIDCKDTREYFKIFRKSNINFVEILFTDYWIANPLYQDLWLELLSRREELARINPYAAVNCMGGMAAEKWHALTHEYPSRMHMIEKYGVDPKQLSHLIRIKYFIDAYIAGKPYMDCIQVKGGDKDYLLRIKRTCDGMSKEEAIALGQKTYDYIHDKVQIFRQHNVNKENEELVEFMNDILYRLISRSLIK